MSSAQKDRSLKHKLYPILLALAHILVGVLLLLNPVSFSSAVVVVAGVWMAVMGILSLVHYFRDDPRNAILKQEFATGLLLLFAGVFLALNPGALVSLFPAMVVVYGAVVLFGGFRYLQMAVDFWRLKQPLALTMFIAALLQLLVAVLFLVNPFHTAMTAFAFIGVFFLLTGIFSLVLEVLERLPAGRKAVTLKSVDSPTVPVHEEKAPAQPAPDSPAEEVPTLDT